MGRLLTVKDIAERLQISRSSAYRVMHDCIHLRVAGGLRVSEQALDRYLATRQETPWEDSIAAQTNPEERTGQTTESTESGSGTRSRRGTARSRKRAYVPPSWAKTIVPRKGRSNR